MKIQHKNGTSTELIDFELRWWKSSGISLTCMDKDCGLEYCEIGETHRGLQCAVMEDTDKYNEIMEQCDIISKAISRIVELNKK